MTTKTYEIVVQTNQDLSEIYEAIGGYITGHAKRKESCEGDYPYGTDDVMANYAAKTKDTNIYYNWWCKNACFKGAYNDTPFDLITGVQAFHDSNFPRIIFSGHESDSEVRAKIKDQFFKKFNVIVDTIDNSTLIDEVKVRIDSDAFTEQYSRKYCYELLKEYEMHEKMFSGYVINKVNVDTNVGVKSAITFYVNSAPKNTEEFLDNLMSRIEDLVKDYNQMMVLSEMEKYCFYTETIEDVLEFPKNFQIVGVDLIEHVTESRTIQLT
jgi:hypothetical protein